MKIRTSTIFLALVSAALLLSGCQSGEDTSSQPQSVEERAQARWDHMIAREFAEAWSYYTPGFRETTSAEEFATTVRKRPVRWEDATVVARDCEGDRCEVVVEVSYSVPQAPAGLNNVRGKRELTETWIRTQEQWWYSDSG
ncbi:MULTISPECIES: hypothetical protein [unclassified Wenzhouxiangella]|uniref:hypothetical protein n=1 Tax=unclassified Wenzhouxiangella TaxID=2613841 RepID=UPI000E329F2C|nr:MULTISPECIES: hypothetical protein [unclassified Wenzhouxiangella]RFF26531.1 hypothetical protein DZK25_12545 [Wenzhouxiangella sp. 15181]RFP67520.1 hypothetical protein DZK26_12325 [Wenzhouxiangella sp. 15190]